MSKTVSDSQNVNGQETSTWWTKNWSHSLALCWLIRDTLGILRYGVKKLKISSVTQKCAFCACLLPSLCDDGLFPTITEAEGVVLSAPWQCLIVLPVSKLQPTMWLLYLTSLNSMPQFKSLSEQKSGPLATHYTHPIFSCHFSTLSSKNTYKAKPPTLRLDSWRLCSV